jgi:hypothetical protein
VSESKPNPVLRARNQAIAALLARFPDEFNEEMGKAAADQGITWQPVLSPEDRASQEIEALLAKYPGLLDRYQPVDLTAKQQIPGQTAIS